MFLPPTIYFKTHFTPICKFCLYVIILYTCNAWNKITNSSILHQHNKFVMYIYHVYVWQLVMKWNTLCEGSNVFTRHMLLIVWRHGRCTTRQHINSMVIGTELRAKLELWDTHNIQQQFYMVPNILGNRSITWSNVKSQKMCWTLWCHVKH